MKALLFSILFFMIHEHRDVYIFYNAKGIGLKNKQIAELNADTTGVKDRDIEIHIINITNDEMGNRWNVKREDAFTFILVGKDGGEKLRSKELVTRKKLFETIDKMPMRKAEMKEKN